MLKIYWMGEKMKSSAWVPSVLALALAIVIGGCVAAKPGASSKADALKERRLFAMKKPGDAARGQKLFLSQKLACVTCHSHDGSGSKVGPDLANLGDRMGRGDIIDSILTPSAVIADGYATTHVKTKDGKDHVGVMKKATADSVEMRVVGAEPLRILTKDVTS